MRSITHASHKRDPHLPLSAMQPCGSAWPRSKGKSAEVAKVVTYSKYRDEQSPTYALG